MNPTLEAHRAINHALDRLEIEQPIPQIYVRAYQFAGAPVNYSTQNINPYNPTHISIAQMVCAVDDPLMPRLNNREKMQIHQFLEAQRGSGHTAAIHLGDTTFLVCRLCTEAHPVKVTIDPPFMVDYGMEIHTGTIDGLSHGGRMEIDQIRVIVDSPQRHTCCISANYLTPKGVSVHE